MRILTNHGLFSAIPTLEDGELYYATDTEEIWIGPMPTLVGGVGATGPAGSSGSTGAAGSNGLDGNTILYGTVAPTTEGINGNFYIRTTTSFIYGPKASGVWPAGTSLVGATGSTGSTGSAGATGATGGLTARTTATKTTASLALNATESSSFAMAKSYKLYSVQTDRAARVRLYQTSAQRDTDLSRAVTSSLADPPYVGTPHGCDLDLTTSGAVTFPLIFECGGKNMDSTPSTTIYCNITNRAATSLVAVIFTYVPLES